MRFRDGRRSVCLSSQSGCPLTCTFCATGSMRFARNLSTSEILDQALYFRRLGPIDHCVFMGMGEPMLNLDAVLGACERLPDLGVTHRRTTISTVGWVPGIRRLAESDMPMRLALSLHAPEDALRSELMPVNERYPLAEAFEACREFYARRRRRVFIEYVMLAGINDRYEQALALARALLSPGEHSCPFKVNLIPYNPTGPASRARGEGRSTHSATRWQEAGVPVTVRLTRGREIAAACGQLAADRPAGTGLSGRRTDRSGTLPAARRRRRRGPRRRVAAARAAPSAPPESGPSVRSRAAPRGSSGRTASGTGPWCGTARAPNWELPASSIRPRSSSEAVAESALTPRMRAISGRETGCM